MHTPFQKLRKRLSKWLDGKKQKERKYRVSQMEQLEARRVLAAAVWNNLGLEPRSWGQPVFLTNIVLPKVGFWV